MRKILLYIKYNIFDRLRPYFNLYNFFIALSPSKKTAFRIFGAKINKGADIRGRVRVFEPAWIQLNRGAKIDGLKINAPASLLLDNETEGKNLQINQDTIILKDGILTGADLPEKRVTFSLDLEGGVGLAHAYKKNWKNLRSRWASEETAYRIRELLKKYSIPATWAVCGHLFLEGCNGHPEFNEHDWYGDWFKYDPCGKSNDGWYMSRIISDLKNDGLFEIGYHSFGHFNYLNAGRETVLEDLNWAKKIRAAHNLKLETFVLPYNGLAHIEEIVAAGFKNLRGYVGQYYLPKTLDFGQFRVFGTSQYVGPKTVSYCVKNMDKIAGRNFNYFTHPEDWVGEDLGRLEFFISKLADMGGSGRIKLSLINDL